MRAYGRLVLVTVLTAGIAMAPSLSQAGDGSSKLDTDGRYRLLNTELRAKLERLRENVSKPHMNHEHGPSSESVKALQAEVARLKADLATVVSNESNLLSQLTAANTELGKLSARLTTLESSGGGGGTTNPALVELAKYVRVDPNTVNGLRGPHVIFHHANVHVQSGAGSTDEAGTPTGMPTGLGNLVVGYNELPFPTNGARDGSHNLVVGPSHAYTSTGGAVLGRGNWISGQHATTLGGVDNRSRAFASSILGGNGVSVSFPEATYP